MACNKISWCCTCSNDYTCMFQVFYLFQTYVTNVSSECFKGRSGVAGCRSPIAAAEVSPWFACRCWRPPQCASVGGQVGAGCGSAMRARDGCWRRFRRVGTGGASTVPYADARWERDGTREMRCGHRAQELCLDAGLGWMSGR
jgi:hypothetical protein